MRVCESSWPSLVGSISKSSLFRWLAYSRLLGVVLTLNVATPFVASPAPRLARTVEQVNWHLSDGPMHFGEASSLRSSWGWARGTLWGRFGPNPLKGIRVRQRSPGRKKRSLAFKSSLPKSERILRVIVPRNVHHKFESDSLFVTGSDGEGLWCPGSTEPPPSPPSPQHSNMCTKEGPIMLACTENAKLSPRMRLGLFFWRWQRGRS